MKKNMTIAEMKRDLEVKSQICEILESMEQSKKNYMTNGKVPSYEESRWEHVYCMAYQFIIDTIKETI